MMGGGSMTLETDAMHGRAVGSHLKLMGVVWGLHLWLEEVVTERIPPRRKVWETVGSPRLVVIGSYQMGFDIEGAERGSRLTVFIDYALPASGFGRWLGLVLGRSYANWCTTRMSHDAAEHFRQREAGA